MPTLSVIIPVYNAEMYVRDCLNCVFKQSFQDYECIVIDDGSNDRSFEILKDLCLKDNRFTLIHKENEGVSVARNVGLSLANGEYITFLDCDDKIRDTYFADMLFEIKGYDLIINGYTLCKEGKEKEIKSVEGDATIEKWAFALKKGLLNSCWGKLYKKDIVKDSKFISGLSWGEDTAFFLSCIKREVKVYFSNNVGYLYRYSENGLANRFDYNKPIYLLKYYEEVFRFLDRISQKGDMLDEEMAIKISQEIFRTIDGLQNKELSLREKIRYLKKLFLNKKVNAYWKWGASIDENPLFLKVLAGFPYVIPWLLYLTLRQQKETQ